MNPNKSLALTVGVRSSPQPTALRRATLAAGAMIYVVIDAVIPEAEDRGNTDAAALGAILGFIVMMILDAALD